METRTIEIKLEEKIKEIKEKLIKRDGYTLKNNNTDHFDWAMDELKKTEKKYKTLLRFSILIIGSVIIVGLLKVFDIMTPPMSNSTMPVFILIVNTIGLACITFRYKIKIENLITFIYLLDIEQEIKKLRTNN